MVRPELANWIREQLSKGFSPEQLAVHMTENGYDFKYAQQTIEEVMKPEPTNPPPPAQEETMPAGPVIPNFPLPPRSNNYTFSPPKMPSSMAPPSAPIRAPTINETKVPWLKIALTIFIVAFILIIGYLLAVSDVFKNISFTPKIDANENSTDQEEIMQEELAPATIGCDQLPTSVQSCEPIACMYTNPYTQQQLRREVVGLEEQNCVYTEEMPGNSSMRCLFPQGFRQPVSEFFTNTKLGAEPSTGQTYNIDGRVVENPIQEAVNIGICVIQ